MNGPGPVMVSNTLCPAVHILGIWNVYRWAKGIADHYWPEALGWGDCMDQYLFLLMYWWIEVFPCSTGHHPPSELMHKNWYPGTSLLSCFYSTLRGKTDKLEEAVNRELNVTRSWNFIQTVDLAWFIPRMSFKLICIFYNFKAPLLENR